MSKKERFEEILLKYWPADELTPDQVWNEVKALFEGPQVAPNQTTPPPPPPKP